VSKETCYSFSIGTSSPVSLVCVKRDLPQCQKRPITCDSFGVGTRFLKRDLLQCQKRPTTVSKETYYLRQLWRWHALPDRVSEKSELKNMYYTKHIYYTAHIYYIYIYLYVYVYIYTKHIYYTAHIYYINVGACFQTHILKRQCPSIFLL
jgi:hypothetical protein